MVAMYGNYTMIINKCSQLFNSVLNSVNAGVGNLVAEGDIDKMLKVFWELTTIRHCIAGILCFSIFFFIEPFISLWLGGEYILDRTILVLFVIFIYISNSRGVIDSYNHAHGLYADVWAAWTELIINVAVTIVGGILWGIYGILYGKIVSLTVIVVFWKPYYLFHSGLHLPISIYWNGTIRYLIIFILSFFVGKWILIVYPLSPYNNYLTWIGYCLTGIFGYLICNITLLWIFAKGSKDCIRRIKNINK